MRGTFIIYLLFVCLFKTPAQGLGTIKTDKDCLHFIHSELKSYGSFYFDTIFTKQEIKRLKIQEPIRNWEVFDFNGDHKPDLYFVGRLRAPYSEHEHLACLYLSNGKGGYDLIPLTRGDFSLYSPLIFRRTNHSKQLLFSYCIITLLNHESSNQIIKRKATLYPKGLMSVDTLVYKYGRVINYATAPSNLIFDSIIFERNDGLVYRIHKEGFVAIHHARSNDSYFETFKVTPTKLSLLKTLVKEIDLTSTDIDFSTGLFDLPGITLSIYSQGNKIVISDYGMQASFTLMAIYRLIESLYEDRWTQM